MIGIRAFRWRSVWICCRRVGGKERRSLDSVDMLHKLNCDIPKPERFTYPFCYEPHPLCLAAVEEVKLEIERIQPKEGKMFGVLVVEEKEGVRREGEKE